MIIVPTAQGLVEVYPYGTSSGGVSEPGKAGVDLHKSYLWEAKLNGRTEHFSTGIDLSNASEAERRESLPAAFK